MDLPPPDFELSGYDLNNPWGFVSYPDETAENNGYGLSDLFEGDDSDLVAQTHEALSQGIDKFLRSPSAPFDSFIQDTSVFGQSVTQQTSRKSVEATDPFLHSDKATETSQQMHPEAPLQLGTGADSISAMGDWPDHIPDEIRGHHVRTSKYGRSLDNFGLPSQFFDDGYPSAPASRSRDKDNHSQGVEIPRTAPSVRQKEDQTYQIFATPPKQKPQHPAAWKPFMDARQGRIWMLKAQDGPSRASLQDKTIPRTTEQKRAVANKLRAAFESAQSPRNEGQFLLLDWTCLELVDEVCLFHMYGPLTQRYLSGMPKHRAAQFNTYDDHIDALVEVIGREDCPKATSLRKRMMDVTHRKRLVDNPLAELGIVQKNEVANTARKLRDQERKAKAARAEAAELEVAKLEAQLSVRSSMEASPTGSDDEWDKGVGRKQSAIATRRFATPSKPSAKLSAAQKSTFMADRSQRALSASASAVGYSSDSFSDNTPPLPFDFGQDRYESTLTNTHGPSAVKKARHNDYQPIALPQPSHRLPPGFQVQRQLPD